MTAGERDDERAERSLRDAQYDERFDDRTPTAPESADPFDDLSRRLEEARRKVREAMGDSASDPEMRGRTVASAGTPSGTVGGGTQRPTVLGNAPQTTLSGRPLVAGGQAVPAPPPAPFLGREGRPRPTPPPSSAREVAERARTRSAAKADTAPALEVDRSVGRSPYGKPGQRTRRSDRRDGRGVVPVDAASIRHGLIWHMILSETAAHGRGRMPSPRRSR